MMKVRRISGDSMSPAIREGAVCLFVPLRPRVGSAVLARQGGREVVKRVERIDSGKYYLVGDNRHESTDSRHYGYIDESAILGVSMIKLPVAVSPPKPLKQYAVSLGRIAAGLLVTMALVHLYRIDTFIPVLDNALPGGDVVASLIALGVIMSEIFAIPFALRMKLSPLAHLLSGALLAFAPLWWLLIAIWNFGYPGNIGLFGSFVDISGAGLVAVLCLCWVALNYYTLYALGYGRLEIRGSLRK